jgi:hypothetical protein
MKIVHLRLATSEKAAKPSRKQQRDDQMRVALRRRQYMDYKRALKDPENCPD